MTLVPNTSSTIDCEVRTLLTQEQYESLKDFFAAEAEARGEEKEETRYFEGEHDLRLQRSATTAKVWLRETGTVGKRSEISIKVAAHKYDDFATLFEALGYKTAIIWKRHRMSFNWEGITVSLDDTKGFGQVVELKKSCDAEWRLETLEILRSRLEKLGLKPTPKPVLHERFQEYRANWQELIADKVQIKVVEEQPAAEVSVAISKVETAEKVEKIEAIETPVETVAAIVEEEAAIVAEVAEVVEAADVAVSMHEAPEALAAVLEPLPAEVAVKQEERERENAPA